jgi:hypothetical protein
VPNVNRTTCLYCLLGWLHSCGLAFSVVVHSWLQSTGSEVGHKMRISACLGMWVRRLANVATPLLCRRVTVTISSTTILSFVARVLPICIYFPHAPLSFFCLCTCKRDAFASQVHVWWGGSALREGTRCAFVGGGNKKNKKEKIRV